MSSVNIFFASSPCVLSSLFQGPSPAHPLPYTPLESSDARPTRQQHQWRPSSALRRCIKMDISDGGMRRCPSNRHPPLAPTLLLLLLSPACLSFDSGVYSLLFGSLRLVRAGGSGAYRLAQRERERQRRARVRMCFRAPLTVAHPPLSVLRWASLASTPSTALRSAGLVALVPASAFSSELLR